ncbi:S8 family peptidase [Luteolibacter sp. Populi]|uniref:S8 family peptidase n=1 Tax=Luteolibacter sp. Populi TaxID=3230487 RepID=UPI003467A07D
MKKQNFLLGRGERLTSSILVRSGGAPKEAPYTFGEARERLAPMLSEAVSDVSKLPADACPGDRAVIMLTLNPEYLAKSYFPQDLFSQIGMELLGSRPQKIKPEKRSRDREPEETMSTQLFASAPRSVLRNWSADLGKWPESHKGASDLVGIEAISAPAPENKIKGGLPREGEIPMELVLHAGELELHVIDQFWEFFKARRVPGTFRKRFFAQGLCFLEVVAPAERAVEIASFSPVRALRKMPELRFLRPTIRSSGIPTVAPELPPLLPIVNSPAVAIFDGGIPATHPITRWVTPFEFPGMSPATAELLEHGVGVSSAALFGHIDPKSPIPAPFSKIDHYRVIDSSPEQNPYELYEVLERIEVVLSSRKYDFVNLSIGPCLPIEDDEIHAWTAVLDDRLAHSDTLATIAVGNDGESDSITRLNRVQVPADCVNALAIGACDSREKVWSRAPYSSIGPGRSPGLVKPDLVEFGGAFERPFIVLNADMTPKLAATGGTSFAAPSAMRMATGIRTHFGNNLNNLAIRSLLVHTV